MDVIIGADELSSTIACRMGRLGSTLWRIGAIPVVAVAIVADETELPKVVLLEGDGTDRDLAALLEGAAAAIRAGRVERTGPAGGGA